MDREGNLFGLFAERNWLGDVDILVLAKHNRSLFAGKEKLFDSFRSAPVRSRLEIYVERSSARTTARNQHVKPTRQGRKAEVALRRESFELALPRREAAYMDVASVRLSALYKLKESFSADGSPPLEWPLFTSLPINN